MAGDLPVPDEDEGVADAGQFGDLLQIRGTPEQQRAVGQVEPGGAVGEDASLLAGAGEHQQVVAAPFGLLLHAEQEGEVEVAGV